MQCSLVKYVSVIQYSFIDDKQGGEFDIWIELLYTRDAAVRRSGDAGSDNFAC
jgi:hypothetical protein